MKYENLARKAEESEMNVKANSSWKNIKKDGRKMWGVIDWKGKSEVNENKILHDSQIQKYFRNIFQSQKTMHHPTVSNIMNKLHNYFLFIPILDELPNMSEVELALNNIHRGIGIDGLPPIVLKILPKVMLDCLLLLIQKVFMSSYPEEWNKQILHAVAKKNHTYHNSDLRGIAIAPLLCSVYDDIIESRLNSWYKPNFRQAGFRKGQGCLLQIFMLTLLIKFSYHNNKIYL